MLLRKCASCSSPTDSRPSRCSSASLLMRADRRAYFRWPVYSVMVMALGVVLWNLMRKHLLPGEWAFTHAGRDVLRRAHAVLRHGVRNRGSCLAASRGVKPRLSSNIRGVMSCHPAFDHHRKTSRLLRDLESRHRRVAANAPVARHPFFQAMFSDSCASRILPCRASDSARSAIQAEVPAAIVFVSVQHAIESPQDLGGLGLVATAL